MKHGQNFKELQKFWYEKLKKESFTDIEDSRSGMLKEWDSNFFRNKFSRVKYESTIKYYELARRTLGTYQFKNEHHRLVWLLHSEGVPERKIAQARGVFYRKSMVHYIINRIKKSFLNE